MAIREYDFEKEPTVSVVKKILNDAIKMKASDIHFDPAEDELVIKFRINGDLIEYATAPDNVKINILTRVKILAGMNITESLIPQLGTISIDYDNRARTMRVSSLPIADGEKIVCHITNYTNSVKPINKLGFNEQDSKKIKEMVREEQGIILITGSANSGKTTTIYSILKEKNTKENNIISIEDPINLKIKGINQVEICPEKGITYRNILKNILLQDPNIIAINELVDDETTNAALRTSLSGRLVISSLQTKTIYQTIENLMYMDVEKYLLGSNLKGIISQRLVKRLCPMCREKKRATSYEAKIIKSILGIDIKDLYYPNGCDDCKDGYIGVIPVAEVAIIDNELKHAISNQKSLSLIRKIIYEDNSSILVDGFNKVINGDTSFQEIMRIMDINQDLDETNIALKDLILGKEKVIEEPDTTDNFEASPEEQSSPISEDNESSTSDYENEATENEDLNNEQNEVDNEASNEDTNETNDEDYYNSDEPTEDEPSEDESNDEDIKEDDDEPAEEPVVDATAEMNDAKELLNRLMGKSKQKVIKKKSKFKLEDIQEDEDDDDDNFDYSDYENHF